MWIVCLPQQYKIVAYSEAIILETSLVSKNIVLIIYLLFILRLLNKFDSNNAHHKEMLAVLAAVTEVIKEQGGKESTTEYFIALVSTYIIF